MKRLVLTLLVFAALSTVQAQQQPRMISPEVHPDRRVTFRLRAPNAKEVFLAREGAPRAPMQKDEQGIWSLTTQPLEPDFYGYAIVVDGVNLIDPSNQNMNPNLLGTQSVVHVPGPLSLSWEVNDVPRGTLHRHFYRSAIVGDDRDFYVYSPPDYDSASKDIYPTLYLLHGFSDDASAWTSVGRAHVILDNLIARGKARPMLVVMPLGYGAPEILSRTGPRDPSLARRNMEQFRNALFQEVIPRVEKSYRASPNREFRAIAGLSMGGAESLFTGLNALDRFAWVGAFSSGGLGGDFSSTFPSLDAGANKVLRLLWVACGTEDRLIENNRAFLAFLKVRQVNYKYVETAGAHTWMVWRRYLSEFAPLLFR